MLPGLATAFLEQSKNIFRKVVENMLVCLLKVAVELINEETGKKCDGRIVITIKHAEVTVIPLQRFFALRRFFFRLTPKYYSK